MGKAKRCECCQQYLATIKYQGKRICRHCHRVLSPKGKPIPSQGMMWL